MWSRALRRCGPRVYFSTGSRNSWGHLVSVRRLSVVLPAEVCVDGRCGVADAATGVEKNRLDNSGGRGEGGNLMNRVGLVSVMLKWICLPLLNCLCFSEGAATNTIYLLLRFTCWLKFWYLTPLYQATFIRDYQVRFSFWGTDWFIPFLSEILQFDGNVNFS